MRSAAVALVLATFAAAAPLLPAQGTRALLRGRVTLDGDTTEAGGVEIELMGTALHHASDRNGRFYFPDLGAGTYILRARLPGFVAFTKTVRVPADSTVDVAVTLERLPTALATVVIEGRKLKVPPRYEEVYARAARGWGKFFTRDDIAKLRPHDIGALLSMVPGILVSDRGLTFQRCNEGLSAGLGKLSASDTNLAFSGTKPKVQVYVDGVRRTNRGIYLGQYSTDELREVLREMPPSSVQAIEVYRGVAQIPGEFLDDACAVVAIWTKSY